MAKGIRSIEGNIYSDKMGGFGGWGLGGGVKYFGFSKKKKKKK